MEMPAATEQPELEVSGFGSRAEKPSPLPPPVPDPILEPLDVYNASEPALEPDYLGPYGSVDPEPPPVPDPSPAPPEPPAACGRFSDVAA